MMLWRVSHRCDPVARELADRHYNRQSIGAANFAPPGRCLVLYAATATGRAFWVTSWQRYVQHAWAGAWICSAFRNEGAGLSSDLITQAVAATRYRYGGPPALGMVTFVDRDEVRRKRDPGRCYRRAGFMEVGETQGGLVALQLLPAAMPPAAPAVGFTLDFLRST